MSTGIALYMASVSLICCVHGIKQIFGDEMEAKEYVSCVNVMTHLLLAVSHGGPLSRSKCIPFSSFLSFDIYAGKYLIKTQEC